MLFRSRKGCYNEFGTAKVKEREMIWNRVFLRAEFYEHTCWKWHSCAMSTPHPLSRGLLLKCVHMQRADKAPSLCGAITREGPVFAHVYDYPRPGVMDDFFSTHNGLRFSAMNAH